MSDGKISHLELDSAPDFAIDLLKGQLSNESMHYSDGSEALKKQFKQNIVEFSRRIAERASLQQEDTRDVANLILNGFGFVAYVPKDDPARMEAEAILYYALAQCASRENELVKALDYRQESFAILRRLAAMEQRTKIANVIPLKLGVV